MLCPFRGRVEPEKAPANRSLFDPFFTPACSLSDTIQSHVGVFGFQRAGARAIGPARASTPSGALRVCLTGAQLASYGAVNLKRRDVSIPLPRYSGGEGRGEGRATCGVGEARTLDTSQQSSLF